MTGENIQIKERNKAGLLTVQSQIGGSGMRKQISLLLNHGFYFLQYAFILVEDHGFRLVVIHQGHLRTNKVYDTLKTARAAFGKMYNRKCWKKGVKASWSPFYYPEADWIYDKIEFIKNYQSNYCLKFKHRNKKKTAKSSKNIPSQKWNFFNSRESRINGFSTFHADSR